MFAREELIKDAESLDPLPASSTRLSKLLSEDDWSLQEVAKIATLDQALTGRLLRYANSAASGAREPITSVAAAVMRMGPNMVLSIALGDGLRKLDTELPAYGLAEGELWRHSVGSALAVEALRKLGHEPPPGTFIAALVHDVGKLVIGRRLHGMGIKLTSGSPDESWVQDEAEQLGIDHAELGANIALFWELPGAIPEAIGHHHCAHLLENGVEKKMAQYVAAADGIAHALDDEEPFWNPMLSTQLGLSPEDQEKARVMTRTFLKQVEQAYP